MSFSQYPKAFGLYDPRFEKESCGVGFTANLKGHRSHEIIEDATEILCNMEHRGAVGAEENTGDGAGILTGLPYEFLDKICTELGIKSVKPDHFGCGLVFLPKDEDQARIYRQKLSLRAGDFHLEVAGWRPVPVDNSTIGPSAKASEPRIEMVFVNTAVFMDPKEVERKLFLLRKTITAEINKEHLKKVEMEGSFSGDKSSLKDREDKTANFYICSLSSRVIVYKGMLTPSQLTHYYPDLLDPLYKSHLAMIHSRFSTNTFPSWSRAQPLRFMSHNGEINTLRGNVNKMKAREGVMSSKKLGRDLKGIFPVIEPDSSDSANFDNVLELLYMSGRSLQRSVMMMIPEAWENDVQMKPSKRAFYEYNSMLMEAWDGPASVVFTDGHAIGAVLDRNGLRPSRYLLTDDDRVIMASESGVLLVPPEKVIKKGRLEPGKMFLVDFDLGRIVEDEEIKENLASLHPYERWLKKKFGLENFLTGKERGLELDGDLGEHLRLFGYTGEHLNLVLRPMIDTQKEALGSMGNDSPLACLAESSRLSYEYFKQLFAQVTNPPIDSIREENIMSLEIAIGPEKNLLETSAANCHRLHLKSPFLTNAEMQGLKEMKYQGWKTKTLDCLIPFQHKDRRGILEDSLKDLCRKAEEAVLEGFTNIVLSDRKAGADFIPISPLLCVGAVNECLINKGLRMKVGLLIESGEPREVHQFCLLAGYGADAYNPYLAIEAIISLFPEKSEKELIERYFSALSKGMRKVLGKMGISTLNSYRGSQIFEAVGLGKKVIDLCFSDTVSRIEGADFDILQKEASSRYLKAFPQRNPPIGYETLGGGDYNWRESGEVHLWTPEAIANLQHAVRGNDFKKFSVFSSLINHRSSHQGTLRGLLKFKDFKPLALEEVESENAIVARFVTGAMSFGSISKEAHETLAIAMNRLKGKSNTGEGGEDPARFLPDSNGDLRRSAIKQVASGRFGVSINYLTNADEIQIKMAQGAKPGEGGELPGGKVSPEIAKTRNSTPGVGLISPPPHHDIYSIEDLAQLIFDLKNANPEARISVKLVSEVGVGTIAAGVVKGHADHILISGHDGGTGASPLTGLKNAGLPWELGLAETHQTLVLNDLRSRVVVQTDGQLKTGRDVVIAALLGAEEFGFSTAALISLGCIMMRKCQKNTCPVGIATQDPLLRKRFTGKPEYVESYMRFVARETRQIMAELGFRNMDEMVGRVDKLEVDPEVLNEKSIKIDLSRLLTPAKKPHPDTQVTCSIKQKHGLENILDQLLIDQVQKGLDDKSVINIHSPISNKDRSVGTLLSHRITQKYGIKGLPKDTVSVKFTGTAGQSFGSWLAPGISFRLEGEANDYVGKGLSGGQLIVVPPELSRFIPEKNIIVGSVAFYGAVAGEAFIRGCAAERFCVRNSGANVVVEGLGAHGCEYMTGGRCVILGPTGRNFAAGMSGGIAYVYDPQRQLDKNCNLATVNLESLDGVDVGFLESRILKHRDFTGSGPALRLLENWSEEIKHFRKVMPIEYKAALAKGLQGKEEGKLWEN